MCVLIRDGKTGNLKLFFPLFFFFFFFFFFSSLFFLKRAAREKERNLCGRKIFDFENTPKTTAFLRVLMHVRHFSIAMKRELKMNTQNTRSGMYLCVHFQRYLCANVEDRDTKRERFFAPESRERRETCVFEFLKKEEEKKNSKKIQKHTTGGVSRL